MSVSMQHSATCEGLTMKKSTFITPRTCVTAHTCTDCAVNSMKTVCVLSRKRNLKLREQKRQRSFLRTHINLKEDVGLHPNHIWGRGSIISPKVVQ